MKYIRGIWRQREVWGYVEGDEVALLQADAILNEDSAPTGERAPLAEVRLLAPCRPGKIIAVGVNYRDHAAEMKEDVHEEDPVIFLKPPSSVIGPEDEIIRPAQSQRVDFEAECAVVIGHRGKDILREDYDRYVFGYTCLNDVTARDLQAKDGQWTRGKGFDTFCPIGPWIETEFDPTNAMVQSRLNGEIRQNSNTRYFIHPVDRVVEYVSAVMTLEPGDIITTGTPGGIGTLNGGDVIEVEVGGIGTLRNRVR